MQSNLLDSWQFWALMSAAFAALTAIFAKVGVENVNSDFATFIRTIVIMGVLGMILVGTGQWQPLASISPRTYLFLILSGLATGGNGDVLSGVIGAFLARGMAPADAAGAALCFAGRAAELAGRDRGLIPRDVVEALPAALLEEAPREDGLDLPGIVLDLAPAR